ncbi:MAG TPA: SCO family protein [Thermoanaerobaculia bacterium]|jgi:cytochrome oxidase Cu insertion factor (SCO1/SenC/PrrC family)|nr:SCO family protein [Thermoanaerobaculia bacterium]
MALPMRRSLLWGLLVAVLVIVLAATVVERLRRPDLPPVMWAAPDFKLTNRDGRTVTLKNLAGEPWIADFIFTRCPASCPMMTARLARFHRDLPRDLKVRLVSFSVDPKNDTPAVLEAYAKSFKAPDRWLFLTGDGEQIYRISKEGFKLAIDNTPPPGATATPTPTAEPILHSTRFALVDGQGRVRGYYEAFDEESMKKMARDLRALAE